LTVAINQTEQTRPDSSRKQRHLTDAAVEDGGQRRKAPGRDPGNAPTFRPSKKIPITTLEIAFLHPGPGHDVGEADVPIRLQTHPHDHIFGLESGMTPTDRRTLRVRSF